MKVLHLTHTNLDWDYRIQREMKAVDKLDSVSQLYGVGVVFDEGAIKDDLGLSYRNFSLLGKRLPKIPIFDVFRQSLTFIEYLIRASFFIIFFRPSVVHAHDTPALIAARLARIFINFSLIYDAHELMPHKLGVTRFTSMFIRTAERFSWSKVDEFITVGSNIKSWYISSYGKKSSTVIFNSPTPHDKTTKTLPVNYIRGKFEISKTSKVFSFVGQFAPGRNIESILETFGRLDSSFHVIFFGFGEKTKIIREAALKHSNIHLHDAVPHSDVISYLKQCDYGLCLIENASLSDQLSMPNKLFEYMQAGLPVLASDLPEIASTVRDSEIGILVDISLDDLETGIRALAKEDREINEQKIAGYLWPAQERKLQSLYARLSTK